MKLSLFFAILVWSVFVYAVTGCSVVPNVPQEQFRVPVKSYVTVDTSQRVCSATDGIKTVVWGCR